MKPWSRPFYPSYSMAKEAGEAAASKTTPSSVAREETSGKARENTPGTDREADGATDIRTTSPNTAREEMTTEEPAENALVIQQQANQEVRETTAARTTLSSVAREEISGKAREETPGTDREATDVGKTLPDTAREEMTPDKATESAMVTQ